MKKVHSHEEKGQRISNPAEMSREDRLDMIKDGLHQLSLELGLMAAQGYLQAEVADLCGPSYQRSDERTARRWGSQGGSVVIEGRKVRIEKPRVRLKDGHEAVLQTYQQMQNPEILSEKALRLMVRGVSCREYEACLEPLAKSFGAKRSSVSRAFVRASAKQMKMMAERRFDGQSFVAVFIDGVPYGGEMMVVALGVKEGAGAGEKVVLGLRQGATENAQVCKDLLTDLRDRGLSFENPQLFVLDGSKALAAAVKWVCGPKAVVQRCQQHKIRNVLSYLPEKLQQDVRSRMSDAYACKDAGEGEKKLRTLVAWLERVNKDAASSLREGLEETLTVAKLRLPDILAKSLVTTNPIESAFSAATAVTARVKHWRGGNMRQRWASAGLLKAEKNFNRLKGYKEIPILRAALDRMAGGEVDAVKETA